MDAMSVPDRIAKLVAQRDNARRLALTSGAKADDYARKGLPLMSEHHRIKAGKWNAAADEIDDQITYERAAK